MPGKDPPMADAGQPDPVLADQAEDLQSALRRTGCARLRGAIPQARVARFARIAVGAADVEAGAYAATHPGEELLDVLPAPGMFQLLERLLGPHYRWLGGWLIGTGVPAPPAARAAASGRAEDLLLWVPLAASAAADAPQPGDLLLCRDRRPVAGPGILLHLAGAGSATSVRPAPVLPQLAAETDDLAARAAALGSGGGAPEQGADLVLAAARLMQDFTPAQVLPPLQAALAQHRCLPDDMPEWVMPERDAVADAPPLPPPGDAGIALCMSVRNHAHMVDRALEGIARQERPFDQVLLIDDGSTDATHDHLCRFAAGRPQVQVFRNPESVGVVAAIMRVLDRVDTGYLVCAAADDLLLPAAAARLSDAAAAWPQAAVVMGETGVTVPQELATGRIGAMAHGGGRTASLPSFIAPSDLAGLLSCRRLSFGTAWTARCDALRQIGGFDPALGPLADFQVALTLSCRYGIAVVPERLSVMTVDAASYSRRTGSDGTAMAAVRDRLLAAVKAPGNADVYHRLAATPSLVLDLQSDAELFTGYFAGRPQHWDLMLRALHWALRHGALSIGRGG